MTRLDRTFSFLAFVIFLSVSPGYGADLKEVVASLEQGYNSLTDVQADFSQRTVIASIKREELGRGELFIKKTAGNSTMFRFDYTKPRQQIISDGKTAWYYLPDNRQVMVCDVSELFAGGSGIALNYLTGMGHLSRDFTISFAGEGRDKKGNYVLDLAPKKPNQVVEKLRLTISAAAVERFQSGGNSKPLFPVVSSVVDDNFGNRTFIELSHVKVNQGIGNDRFTFRIPNGVEVLKSR